VRALVRVVGALAATTYREQWRSVAFLAAMAFSGLMLYMSLLLSMLAVDQELRVLLDFGLSFIELMAVVGAVFGGATNLLREMETKAIYLILTRPVPRPAYLLGRYLGLLAAMASATGVMACLHLGVLLSKGWSWQWGYPLALLGIGGKTAIAAALAFLVALVTTSPLSALTMTGILWALGHFVLEMQFLAKRAASAALGAPLSVLTGLLPNLQLLNFRDRLDIPASVMPSQPILGPLLYAAAYSAVCLLLAQSAFRRKEL